MTEIKNNISGFVPGQIETVQGEIALNVDRQTITIKVENLGDRPIQIGSHYHFYEVNDALSFERELTKGFRLNIPAGTAKRFEPGQSRTVELVAFGGKREVYGFQGKLMGVL